MPPQAAHGAPHSTPRLSQANLEALGRGAQQPDVTLPTYDRSRLKAGIVHIGVGGFHRAHMAMYLEQLLERGLTDLGLCGVGLLPHDHAMGELLRAQDHLFTVLVRGKTTRAQVVGAMVDYLHAPSDPLAVLDKLADPGTTLVSLTVTESGYYVNEANGRLDITHPDIAQDLEAPRTPKTLWGYLVQALGRRKEAGLPPFTVVSCDNIEHNGHLTKRMLLAFARAKDAELADWIARHGAFPNSMVDRITPRTTDADRADTRALTGMDDQVPVVTEPFTQWVIEDRFACGRPPLERVGVQIVPDVAPYEAMKLRLLNGSHSAMAYTGYLAGFSCVHEVMADPTFRRFIAEMMDLEVRPILPDVPGIDLAAYARTLLERFDNVAIADQIERLSFDGSGKLPKFILPSIEAQLRAGGSCKRLILCVAAWMRYLTGESEQGTAYPVSDPMAGQLQPLARQGREDPSMLLAVPELFTDALRQSEAFTQGLGEALRSLYAHGVRATLARYLE